MNKFIRLLRENLSLDLRALGLMRIGIAVLLLFDICIRASDLEAHYTDAGVLPLLELFQHHWNPWNISLHTISGAWPVQALLFAAAACFAVAMLVGWKTRAATILSWFFLVSVQNRNPMILQGGDDLLRMALFWAIFLPWHKRYSVDALQLDPPQQNTYFSMATVAYMVQIASVYFFSAVLKDSPEWRAEGTALYYALSLDQMVFPLGKLIYPYPELLKFLTHLVFYMELIVPFLFFIPFYNTFFRVLAILLLTSLHIGISLALFVGLFFMIGIITLIGLLPSSVMDKVERRISAFMSAGSGFLQNMHHTPDPYEHPTATSGKSPLPLRKIAVELFLGFCLVYTFLWNWNATEHVRIRLPLKVIQFAQLIRIDQHWGMFAPSVFKDDGWYILEGRTKDNTLIDLNRAGQPVDYAKPASVVSLFKNDRWRKYSENYLFIHNSPMRPYYCRFILKKWNEEHEDKYIHDLKVIYMKEVTQPDYKAVTPVREVLASSTCVSNEEHETQASSE